MVALAFFSCQLSLYQIWMCMVYIGTGYSYQLFFLASSIRHFVFVYKYLNQWPMFINNHILSMHNSALIQALKINQVLQHFIYRVLKLYIEQVFSWTCKSCSCLRSAMYSCLITNWVAWKLVRKWINAALFILIHIYTFHSRGALFIFQQSHFR